MSVTVLTKDVGDVRNKMVPQCEYVRTDLDRIEDWIKRELKEEEFFEHG